MGQKQPPEVFYKETQNSQENSCVRPGNLLKKTGTGVLL